MTKPTLTPTLQRLILQAQKTEITEAIVYKKIANLIADQHNKKILLQIAEDELRHYHIWKHHSGKDVKPNKRLIWLYM
jgi:rubrerythrin